METEQLKLFEDDLYLAGIVAVIEMAIEKQEYCPFVVVAVKRYIEANDGDEF